MKLSLSIGTLGLLVLFFAAFFWKDSFTTPQAILMSAGYLVIAIGAKE